MFILGAELDRDHLLSYLIKEGLFGVHVFEHLLQQRNYCGAYYAFVNSKGHSLGRQRKRKYNSDAGSTRSTSNSGNALQ